jgi:hypothetical protein
VVISVTGPLSHWFCCTVLGVCNVSACTCVAQLKNCHWLLPVLQ